MRVEPVAMHPRPWRKKTKESRVRVVLGLLRYRPYFIESRTLTAYHTKPDHVVRLQYRDQIISW